MDDRRDGLSIPHARLGGEWRVLRETDDGRVTIAVQADDTAGTAFAYPDRGGVETIAAHRNARAGILLVSTTADSPAAAADLVANVDAEGKSIPGDRFRSLSQGEIIGRLDGGKPLLVRDDDHPGVLQLFDRVADATPVWIDEYPRLGERLVVVNRVLSGTPLHEVVDHFQSRSGHSD